MPKLIFEYRRRIDENTFQCVVWFNDEDSDHGMRILVPVRATRDELPEPSQPDAQGLQQVPQLSPEIRHRALLAAQDIARAFARSTDRPSSP
jgi:hypothetical protein